VVSDAVVLSVAAVPVLVDGEVVITAAVST
jgi:hypothetical protein